jgi:hypothetical protein
MSDSDQSVCTLTDVTDVPKTTQHNQLKVEEIIAYTFFVSESSKLSQPKSGPVLIPGMSTLQDKSEYYPVIAKLYMFCQTCASIKLDNKASFRRHYLGDFGRAYISEMLTGKLQLTTEEVNSPQFQNVLKITTIPIDEEHIKHLLSKMTLNDCIAKTSHS